MSPALRKRWKRKTRWQYALSAAVGSIGIYQLWRATQVAGSMQDRAFGFGLALLLCAFATAWHWRSSASAAREGMLETEMQNLRLDLRQLETSLTELRVNMGCDEAARKLAGAIEQANAHTRRRPWVQLVPDEERQGS
jgi:hypothetical protein